MRAFAELPAVRSALLVAALSAGAACVDRLPDQDRRILAAVAVAKMSPEDLWKDFQSDKDKAGRTYFGKAVVITGRVTSVDSTNPAAPFVLFAQTETTGVRAYLLDDQAPEIVKSAAAGERLALKCFCEGLDSHLILKSCVIP